jgi:hypothetical protein
MLFTWNTEFRIPKLSLTSLAVKRDLERGWRVAGLKHDPEKWITVFLKDHAQSKT